MSEVATIPTAFSEVATVPSASTEAVSPLVEAPLYVNLSNKRPHTHDESTPRKISKQDIGFRQRNELNKYLKYSSNDRNPPTSSSTMAELNAFLNIYSKPFVDDFDGLLQSIEDGTFQDHFPSVKPIGLIPTKLDYNELFVPTDLFEFLDADAVTFDGFIDRPNTAPGRDRPKTAPEPSYNYIKGVPSIIFPENITSCDLGVQRFDDIKQMVNSSTNLTIPAASIVRQRYVREIHEFANTAEVKYYANPSFDLNPYACQIYRVGLDLYGSPNNKARYGLCPFCPSVHFYSIRTSSYGQHLLLHHGVRPNNYLVPNPIMPNIYIFKKGREAGRIMNTQEQTQPGVVCPTCSEIIITKGDLGNYLRHYRDFHCKRDELVSLKQKS